MGKIKVMDSHLANMIAAGEVIERPSSVIKELVENALDANAKHIEVLIENAGRDRIVVKDDGDGMDKDDAILCFTRHASSKLYDEYHLFRIKTMGFRGEALPSIASVSKVSLYTSTGNGVGSKVEAFEDQIIHSDYSMSKGTIFEVKELFYNTPVRLKYLKSDNTEVSSCIDVMQRIALSYPEVSFDLTIDGRKSFSTTGRGDLLETIARIFGTDTAKRMKEIKGESLEYNIYGYIGKPELTRSSRYYMITILNKRNVYLPRVQKVLIDAYKDYIFSNQYPFVILHIEADPSLVDVNVHPSKKEVRLSSEDLLLKLIKDTVKDKLKQMTTFHDVMVEKKSIKENDISLFEDKKKENVEIYRPRTMDYNQYVEKNLNKEEIINENIDAKIEEVQEKVKEEASKEKVKIIPSWKVIGQIHKTYIVYEGDDGFYIMDQHAAMERINYEKFQNLYNSHYDIVSPLYPITIDLSISLQKHLTQEKISALKEIGIEVESFGPNTIRILSYPTFIDEKGMGRIYLESIFHDVLEGNKIDIKELRRHVIATMACKASIKANDELSPLEMEDLLKQLFRCDNPTCCPHGRPTVIHFSSYDIEKLFKRSGI